jgi:hypothetical protein
MLRPLLFLAPFAAYVLFLWATRAGVLHPDSWSLPVLGWLTGAALALIIASFVLIAQFTGAPPGSTYVPAHVENGRFVPGILK